MALRAHAVGVAAPCALALALSFALSAAACGSSTQAPRSPGARARVNAALDAAPRTAPPALWSYDVAAGDGARELAIEAEFPAGAISELAVAPGAGRFVRDVEISEGGAFRAAALREGRVDAAACAARPCRVRYRFALAEAAAALDDQHTAIAYGAAVEAPPSTWLLRPAARELRAGDRYRFRASARGNGVFLTGVHRGGGGGGGDGDGETTYEAETRDLPDAPFAAIGAWRTRRIALPGAALDVAIAPNDLRMSDDEIAAWIGDAGRDLARYFGAFPVPRALIVVVPGRGERLGGTTLGNGGASVLMRVGASAREARASWVLTHELVHLAFPSLGADHTWMEEGLATYVEPIVRVRAGAIDAARFWRDLAAGLPSGLPGAGDEGLRRTHTWGRTYWGGALFFLLADIEARERSGNARSLDDALRAVLAAGGNVASTWDATRIVSISDAAVGAPVFRTLYTRLADAPGTVDLAALFARLGVSVAGARVTFDDRAPLAAVRRAITAR